MIYEPQASIGDDSVDSLAGKALLPRNVSRILSVCGNNRRPFSVLAALLFILVAFRFVLVVLLALRIEELLGVQGTLMGVRLQRCLVIANVSCGMRAILLTTAPGLTPGN